MVRLQRLSQPLSQNLELQREISTELQVCLHGDELLPKIIVKINLEGIEANQVTKTHCQQDCERPSCTNNHYIWPCRLIVILSKHP